MLLMWDRGLHSFKMVNAIIKQKGHFLGRLPVHAKFEVVKLFPDGSYKSWIVPDGESKRRVQPEFLSASLNILSKKMVLQNLPFDYEFNGYC